MLRAVELPYPIYDEAREAGFKDIVGSQPNIGLMRLVKPVEGSGEALRIAIMRGHGSVLIASRIAEGGEEIDSFRMGLVIDTGNRLTMLDVVDPKVSGLRGRMEFIYEGRTDPDRPQHFFTIGWRYNTATAAADLY